MSFKLIACDLDGTLLDNNKEVSTNTINRINNLLNQGLLFVIATGRPFTGTKRYCDLFNKNMPVILYNGSIVRMSKTNELLFNVSLDKEDAKKIINIINEHQGTYIYWKDEIPFVNRIDDYINDYVKISKVTPKIDPKGDYDNITKIIWFDENKNLLHFEETLFGDLDKVNHFTSEAIYLEFVNKRASKEKALESICDYYKIKKEDVITIGDGNNDIGLIKYAGLGVAMDNAKDNVKRAAKFITKSNNDEGVLFVLNKYLK